MLDGGRERLGSQLEREAVFDLFNSLDRSTRLDRPRWVEAVFRVDGSYRMLSG